MRRLLIASILAAACLLAWVAHWWWMPVWSQAMALDIEITPGQSAGQVANTLAGAGASGPAWLWTAYFRLSGQSARMKAGVYEIAGGATPAAVLDKFVRGDQALRSITFVEGWTFRSIRDSLSKAEHLRQDSRSLSAEKIMEMLGKAGVHPEGRFFPDTYSYGKSTSDLELLRRAAAAMDRQLEAAWSQRAPDLPLRNADEALVLASIIEKETGRPEDRAKIGGVFANRLRIGMPLQTDPTVIYGMGVDFDGNLRRRDLLADTPWNTYTRRGLPPTPIAGPGTAALMAAVRPAATDALYFVARGDGSSAFSATLAEHNRAVDRYQRRQGKP